MIERYFLLDEADPTLFYGVGNANLRMLRSLQPKVRLVARGDVVKVLGVEEDVAQFETLFERLKSHCIRFNTLSEEDILATHHGLQPREESETAIVYSTTGKPITARTAGQRHIVEAFGQNDLIFAVGPAGTGKTYVAIALAVRALKQKEVRRIILSRPAVEAGEKLGFLPGDMKDKVDPYLQPLYDALGEMLPAQKLQEYIETGVIQIAPLAFMRGRTLSDAVVILDEAQNTTRAQLRMFLTRLGHGTKMIVTGDVTQIDLPASQRSGLAEAHRILGHIEGIRFVHLDETDIVRHKLVTRIVQAYEQHAQRSKSETADEVHQDSIDTPLSTIPQTNKSQHEIPDSNLL
ncbi:MAG: PhoH family protein [Bacteroidaceae bacterium]|nr:PhoH family protein [Bacteroidaceae bacterium]